MYHNKKFLTYLFIAAALLLSTFHARSQQSNEQKYTHIEHNLTIGFQTGRSILFHLYKPSRKLAAQYTSVFVNFPITYHINISTGLTYSAFRNLDRNSSRDTKVVNIAGRYPGELSIPINIEYHFLGKNNRLRPYAAAGIRYNDKLASNNAAGQYTNLDLFPQSAGQLYQPGSYPGRYIRNQY